MENIEFIPASNLPLTEASEVDVLCVENGELKRKAGASLGGGGAETPDMVVTTSADFGSKLTSSNTTITFGSVSAVLDAVRAGRQPIVKVQYKYGADDYAYARRGEINTVVELYGESFYLSFVITSLHRTLSNIVRFDSDGSIGWTQSKYFTENTMS